MINKSLLRDSLFRHLDGIVTAPSAYALLKHGVTDYILQKEVVSLAELTDHFNANDGYLNVALRICCSQGWLDQEIDNEKNTTNYRINNLSAFAFNNFYLYEEATSLLKLSEKYHNRTFELKPFLFLEKIYKNLINNYGLEKPDNELEKNIHTQIFTHIEGIILGPTIVHLGMSGMFHKYFMEASFKPEEFHKDSDSFERLLDIFTHYGWFNKKNATYQFTDKGLFYAKRASAYGVTVSYIPTLRKLDELIFGDPMAAKKLGSKTEEGHVDRAMNVWGSGGAHSSYFKVVDEIIIEIFNKPIEDQPKGILDMGCGNGAFLQHLFNVIALHTRRGKMLEEHPLILVGADYNNAALKITKANLIQSDIWAKVVHGDIGRPDLLAEDLDESYGIELKELLNVRSFLDHNRIWKSPQNAISKISQSTGAYTYEGKKLNNNDVQQSLLEHFNDWMPYVKKHGLLLIELHTVDPKIVAQNIGRTAATAYDGTHGYSDQYILEIDVFNQTLEAVGLYPSSGMSRKFPNSELATVSINLLQAK